jgi:hypothetical protein
MTWVFVVLIALAVVIIGLVVVGRITGQLSVEPATTYVDIDDAVVWVGDRLTPETSAEISYDDVRAILGWYLDYLSDQGIARSDDIDPAPVGPLMADEDDALASVLGRLAAAGDDAPALTDAQVVEICDAHRSYLLSIGAVRSIDS